MQEHTSNPQDLENLNLYTSQQQELDKEQRSMS